MKFFILFVLFLFNMKALGANVTKGSETEPAFDIEEVEAQIREACSYLIPASEAMEQFKTCRETLSLDECRQKQAASQSLSNFPANNPIIQAFVAELVFCSTAAECYEETAEECENRNKKAIQCSIEKTLSAKERYCSHPNFPGQS